MRAQTERLGTEPVTPLLLRLALPSMVGLLIGNLYVVVGRMFVGHYIGAPGLAAMNAAMPISMIIFAIAILIGRGTAVLYSIELGRKNYPEVQKLFGQSMLLYIIASAVITIGGIAFLDPLLYAFGLPESALPYGRSYLSVSLFGTIFVMLGFQNNLIRAEGYSNLAMFTQIIGAVLNVILEYLFVGVFQWGMAGSAWATLIAQGVAALWVMAFFRSRRSIAKLNWPSMKLYGWKSLGSVFYNGCSPFAINIAGSVIWTVQNHMLLTYGGELSMAAFGVILTVNQILMTPLFGICMGMQPLIGYNTGAKKFRRVLDIFYRSVLLSAIFALGPYLLVQMFPHQLFAMFISDNPKLLELGTYSMRLYLLLLPLGCGTILISQYFQGIGRAPVALLIAMLRQLVFQLPLTFLLPLAFGYDGVLFSGPVGDMLAFLVGCWIMRREIHKLRRLATEQELQRTTSN